LLDLEPVLLGISIITILFMDEHKLLLLVQFGSDFVNCTAAAHKISKNKIG
jgi:hypothetical protein